MARTNDATKIVGGIPAYIAEALSTINADLPTVIRMASSWYRMVNRYLDMQLIAGKRTRRLLKHFPNVDWDTPYASVPEVMDAIKGTRSLNFVGEHIRGIEDFMLAFGKHFPDETATLNKLTLDWEKLGMSDIGKWEADTRLMYLRTMVAMSTLATWYMDDEEPVGTR